MKATFFLLQKSKTILEKMTIKMEFNFAIHFYGFTVSYFLVFLQVIVRRNSVLPNFLKLYSSGLKTRVIQVQEAIL